MRFFRIGKVNFPRRGHAIWFMAQYIRFRYLTSEPSYTAIANELILSDLYKQVADTEGCPVPGDDMAPFAIKLDGVEFDPADRTRRPRGGDSLDDILACRSEALPRPRPHVHLHRGLLGRLG